MPKTPSTHMVEFSPAGRAICGLESNVNNPAGVDSILMFPGSSEWPVMFTQYWGVSESPSQLQTISVGIGLLSYEKFT